MTLPAFETRYTSLRNEILEDTEFTSNLLQGLYRPDQSQEVIYLIANILSMPLEGVLVRLFCVYDLFKLITDTVLNKQVESDLVRTALRII